MKKRFTILAAAFALLAFLAIPMGMRGQTRTEVTYDFSEIPDFNQWGSSYSQHVVEYDDATVTFAAANRNTQTITDIPVTKGQPVSLVLNDLTNNITSATFVCRQWGTKAQTITLHYSTDGGSNFTSTNVTSNNFTISSSSLPEGTNAVRITFSSSSNQVGIESATINFSASTSTAVATQVAIDDAGITNTDVYTTTEAGSLSATVSTADGQAIAGAIVTWSSSDENVATIDSNGEVTLVAAGTTTITAAYAGVGGQYLPSSTTYSFVVTDSTPFTGGDVTFVAAVDKDLNNVSAGAGSITKDGVTFTCDNGILGNGSEYRLYKNSNTTFSTQNGTITSIVFTCTSGNPASGFGDMAGFTTDGNNGTWTGSAQEVSFTASGAQVRATQIVVTVDLNATPDPVITADNVSIDYTATSGDITYTIGNTVEGATLETVVATGATISNFVLGAVGANSIPFTCDANNTTTVRTATVTLNYVKNNEILATEDVTVTQAGVSESYTTIPALFAAATDTETNVLVTFNNWVVSGVTSNGKNVFVTDNNGNGFVIFDNNGGLDQVYSAGSILSGAAVSCTLKKYNGFAELLNVTATDLTITEGGTVTTTSIAMADLAGVNTGALVYFDGLTCSVNNNKYYLTDGTTTLQVYNSLYAFEPLENGKIYNITGVYQQYNNTKEILPRSANDIEEVAEPSIAVSTATVNVPAVGAEGTIGVTYQNIDEIVANIYFCDAEGEAVSYDWIDAEVNDEDNIAYTVSANNGEARTAYLKVYSGNIYSNLVTINQAAYVAPTYAELPFEFNLGIAAIEETDGLYQEGLGSDYNSAPYLKFNDTGDWLLLQFNERPGTLTFKIKNNSFSGGTFTVQTSEDGVTYTDLAVYTEIIGTQDEEFPNLGENVRYIKWIYTNKASGNVGLGNIALNGYTEPESSITLDTYNIEVAAEGGEGSVNVTYQNFSGSYCDVYFYAADGVTNATYDWITAELDSDYNVHYVVQANTGEARIAYFKVGDGAVLDDVDLKSRDGALVPPAVYVYSDLVTVTQAAYVPPFEPATYTLATTIESGKTYIIVGQGDGNYYAMGQQNNNNRAAVGIAVNGTTATVSSEEVYEFTISSLAADGFYSIYDARTPGYLYAAASGSNHLKTESELDSDHNGEWEITFDTDNIASIVASQSSNRNVMQYNSSANLFSCYSSASQHPVYLYVKEETSQTVTQTIELAAGTNWVSTYVEITKEDLQNALVAALSDPAGTVIKSQNGNSTYRGGRWRDQSFTWDVAKMYKIVVPEDCVITLTGTPINPAEHPITIAPNAPTWIGFPFAESMTPAQAIPAGFAVNADIIKGKDGNARYGNGNWRAQGLNSLEPGKGYMYVSGASATEERTLVYPSAK